MNPIPCVDLKRQHQSIKEEIVHAISNVCNDASFSGGRYIEKFEAEFAEYCGVKYCVAINSGTSALQLSMIVLDVGVGDEVLVPANGFIAAAWAVSYVGATPVFVDCDPATWQLDCADVEAKISNKTKAIIGVHLHGQPFDVNALQLAARKYNLPFVEDASHAHGARFAGKRVGAFGALGCFSFYPTKNLGTYGEGGCVTTNNEAFYNRLLSLRNNGSTKRYQHDELGYNMRMGGIEAAVLSVKLGYLDKWNARRKDIAGLYRSGIVSKEIVQQYQLEWADAVYHHFVVLASNRSAFMRHLQERSIFPDIHYPVPIHLQKAYSFLGYAAGDFPNAEYVSKHCVSLPMFPEMTDAEVQAVINAVNSYGK